MSGAFVLPEPANLFRKFDLRGYIDSLPGSPRPFDRGRRPRDHIYASEIGSCARAVWLNWHGEKPKDPKYELERGALGHAVEDMVARQLARILVMREVHFTAERVSGRVDFVVQMGDQQVPIEMKSTYGFSWAMSEPYAGHLFQLRWYMQQMDVRHGLLLYMDMSNYNDNSGHWETLQVPRDDAALDERVDRLWSLVHADAVPECEHKNDPRGCFDCSHAAAEPGH